MDFEDVPRGTIDPEVRAYVYSLVSALGGTGADEDGRYILGDDALACLKDLKRWLKLHDEKLDRLDVARCLAEANLLKGDILEILAAWPEEATEDRAKLKISLACLELLVPLTWPIEKNDLQMTVNHHRHVPYLQLAQVSYKKAIFEHESAKILRNVVRTGLPSMALPIGERTTRDEGIIKLLLYFFRNIAIITPAPNLPIDGNGEEISRSATIEAFYSQDVLALLLTISSNMGEDFDSQDVVIMEILFHLLKGINIEKLFMDKTQRHEKNTDDLQDLISTEAGMHRNYAKNAPTRHNRFGTMIWVKRDDARHSTLSGQDVLSNAQHAFQKMDQSKKWNKPKQRGKGTDLAHDRFDLEIPLTDSANSHLRGFVEEFLDSSFNPLFNQIRKAIEREADRVLEAHTQQFFYLISWFLEAERIRRIKKAEADKQKKSMDVFEADNFALIASVLNQETFIALNRFMQDRLDMKAWREVQAGMRCFTQILLIVQEMAESPVEEDQEIAENIQNRIFYEETTHDRIIAILRGYKDQGFGYLDACTELSHVFLRMLERYSKLNVDLQIRSRRRARARRKTAAVQRDNSNQSENENSEAEDAEVERISKERKFDLSRFSAKFMNQSCIDTFVSFTKYYSELNMEQLKRAHRFFYRVAFKQELSVMLFRLDIISLFNKMIKGPQALNSANQMFREWDELIRQLIKKLINKLQKRPELAVELLFSKIHSSVFFLENGYEKQTIASRPRAPAVLEVKGALTRDEQIGVAVAVLHDQKIDSINWVAKILLSAANERQSWETEALARQLQTDYSQEGLDVAVIAEKPPLITVVPDNEERRIAMFKDNKLRLLMTLAGFERLDADDEPNATWIIPSSLSAKELHESREIIEKHRNNPIMEYGDEDPVSAEDMLRRASTTKARRAEYDDDSEGEGIISDDEEFLFPAGGPTNNNRKSALENLKKRRKPRNSAVEEETDDETKVLKREARKMADLERRRKIKSEKFVRDSDEETDEEQDRDFFAKEEERRKGQAAKVHEAFKAGKVVAVTEGRKRKSIAGNEGESKRSKLDLGLSDSDAAEPSDSDSSSPRPRRADVSANSDTDSSATPLSSPRVDSSHEKPASPHQKPSSPRKKARLVGRRLDSSQERIRDKASALTLADMENHDLNETEKIAQVETLESQGEDMPSAPTGRRRGRLVLLDDSDDDE